MPVTPADIARELGVSKMTVSRAINDHPLVSPETRERVLKVARRPNYRPKPAPSPHAHIRAAGPRRPSARPPGAASKRSSRSAPS